jgi:hypothetical protein
VEGITEAGLFSVFTGNKTKTSLSSKNPLLLNFASDYYTATDILWFHSLQVTSRTGRIMCGMQKN